MKHFLPILWWLGAIPVITLIVISLGYPFTEALAIAILFVPGMFCARYFLPQISFEKPLRGIYHALCLFLSILVLEYLAIFLANHYITQTGLSEIPPILTNPFFLLLVIAAFVTPEMMLERHLSAQNPYDKTICFTSDRRKITLDPSEILYIESNDSEVLIRTVTEDSYRTKTRISQWEAQLDKRFVRIHRSYIVNRDHASECTARRIVVGGKAIEISRKYKESALQQILKADSPTHG